MKGRVTVYIVIFAAVVAVALITSTYPPAEQEQPSYFPSGGYANEHLLVEPDWVERYSEDVDVRIVDVRDESKYGRGHIPGAVNIYYRRFQMSLPGSFSIAVSVEEFEDMVGEAGITPETTVLLYDSSDNLDAALAFWVFEYYGHKNARLLNGGFQRWVSEGRTVEEGGTVVKRAEYAAASVREDRVATAGWIVENLDASDVKILDVRSESEYTGEVHNTKRGGHIPGAVNIEWVEALNPDGTFKAGDVLLKMYRDAGITQDKEVMVYCQSGHRASHGYFVLRLLGYPEVRVYDRSWLEWGNRSGLPIEGEG
ncbi:MAG: sulfurtransferase [Nitrososphaerales archaeon]